MNLLLAVPVLLAAPVAVVVAGAAVRFAPVTFGLVLGFII